MVEIGMKRSSLRFLAVGFGVCALVLGGAASARSPYHDNGSEFARVVEVRPIIETLHQPVSHDRCWSEPVTYREPARYQSASRDRAPAILGGIIGGALGNQFGSGRGRDAATVAGAALGYSLVRDSQRHGAQYRGGREYTRYEERCRTVTEHRREEQVVGYDVAYVYGGRTHWTRTDYHPGERIRVQVDVRPVH
jgi:uncharacterized protein YcfJ